MNEFRFYTGFTISKASIDSDIRDTSLCVSTYWPAPNPYAESMVAGMGYMRTRAMATVFLLQVHEFLVQDHINTRFTNVIMKSSAHRFPSIDLIRTGFQTFAGQD